MANPRFQWTKELERYQRQFYQWWHKDILPLKEIAENFNVLFKYEGVELRR